MSAPGEGGGLVERIAAVLADHGPRQVWEPPGNMIGWGCRCGWGSEGGYALPAHEAHVAAALLALVQTEQAAAWQHAHDEACPYAPTYPACGHRNPHPAEEQPDAVAAALDKVIHRLLHDIPVTADGYASVEELEAVVREVRAAHTAEVRDA